MHYIAIRQEVTFWLANIIRKQKGHMEYSKSCDGEFVIVFIHTVCFTGESIELVVWFFFIFLKAPTPLAWFPSNVFGRQANPVKHAEMI